MPILDGAPAVTQFRIETSGDIIHFIFDLPDRSMNVFSNKAIHELDAFSTWLKGADAKGVVVRSGKESAFCAGADLTELGVAYDMIIAARPEDRFDLAFDHFFPLSRAIRKLERSGKPVAAAIAGLALGGGCELALGAHYRVLADSPAAALGLPESLVGLLPGAGGTQRLPRLVGLDVAIPMLLEGARLSGEDALKAGLINEVASPSTEVECAERWVRNAEEVRQPWDEPGFAPPVVLDVAQELAPLREKILSQTLGHYPAPLAILDCIEQGLPQSFDA
ncbi:enoyl-CoA hydratase-related protein, partial [Hyphococcus sp.]